MPLPPKVRLLDPRPNAQGLEPIVDAVRIPVEELPARVHELPPRHGRVLVANVGESAERAVKLLREIGREAELVADWRPCDDGVGGTCAGRLWSPNSFLVEVAEGLTPGRAADLACGSGRDAVALAGMGWEVTAVDHLPDALALGRDLASRYLDEHESSRIEWQVADLENGSFDLPSNLNLVSMAWYLNRPLLREVAECLAPGGSLVLETFTAHHREVHGKPRTAAFVLQEGELLDLPLAVRSYEADWHDGRHSLRAWFVKE